MKTCKIGYVSYEILREKYEGKLAGDKLVSQSNKKISYSLNFDRFSFALIRLIIYRRILSFIKDKLTIISTFFKQDKIVESNERCIVNLI